MKPVLLFTLLALAACSSGRREFPMSDAQCRAEAYDKPEVKEAISRYVGLTWNAPDAGKAQADELAREAYLNCMRARGLAPPGGVEKPRRAF
ncbi:MAG TPA: phosphoribosylamine--glycine ligase [Acetobacteraceae bacterium]|jgi:hypothetical protein